MTPRLTTDDDGLSLVELIVAIVISGLFAGMLTAMLVGGWGSQDRSVSRDIATGQANVVKTTMSNALRNATAVRVSAGGTRLDAQVATPTASYDGAWTWECRAWALVDGALRYSAGSTIRDSAPATWTPIAGTTAQRPLDTAAGTIGAGSTVPFVLVGSKGVQVGLELTVVGSDIVTVEVSDGMTAQAAATAATLAGATACWL